MQGCLVAIVFAVGSILLLGGLLFYGNLFGASGAAIGIGAVLCVLASIAKERIDGR
jgi:membrane associated rhomboid family serine protease